MDRTAQILKGLSDTLQNTIPKFKEVKEASDQIMNQVITQEMEMQMTPEQRQLVRDAKSAFNLKDGMPLDEKLDELNKMMKRCQYK